MTNNNNGEGEQFRKVSFDARQHFYKVMEIYMRDVGQAQVKSDFTLWYRLEMGLISLVNPFIKKKDREEILEKCEVIKNYLNKRNSPDARKISNPSLLNQKIDSLLIELHFKVYDAAKHMLLPLSEVEEDEFDFEAFKRQSGL